MSVALEVCLCVCVRVLAVLVVMMMVTVCTGDINNSTPLPLLQMC